MTADEYQVLALQTAKPFYKAETNDGTFKNLQLCTAALALAGEAGELGNKIKKMIEAGEYVDHNFREIFKDELGDIQWYIPLLCYLLGTNLEDLMGHNISKLRERYKDQLSHRRQ
jgi:NTP pyrophosphatase (non-canonical NTP hydrolase)